MSLRSAKPSPFGVSLKRKTATTEDKDGRITLPDFQKFVGHMGGPVDGFAFGRALLSGAWLLFFF